MFSPLTALEKAGPENKLIRSGEKATAAVACGQRVPVLLTTSSGSMAVLSQQARSFINYLHPMFRCSGLCLSGNLSEPVRRSRWWEGASGGRGQFAAWLRSSLCFHLLPALLRRLGGRGQGNDCLSVELEAGRGCGGPQLASPQMSLTISMLVMKAVCLCCLLTPAMTLAIKPSKGISKIRKIQLCLCEFSMFFSSQAARETEMVAGRGRMLQRPALGHPARTVMLAVGSCCPGEHGVFLPFPSPQPGGRTGSARASAQSRARKIAKS